MNVVAPEQREESFSTGLASEFVYGGHLLALGTVSIAAFSAILLGDTPTIPLLVMAYLFSYGAYMVNRSVELDQDAVSHPKRTLHLVARRRYLTFIAGSCFGVGYILAAFANIPFFIALLTPLFLSLAYSVGSKKLVPLMGVRRFKEKLLAKNVVISFGWSLIPLLVAMYYSELSLVVLLLMPFVFMRLLVNTIFFDVRDLEGDRKNNIRTIPAVYGFVKSFTTMDLIDLASGGYIVGIVALGILPFYTSIMIVFPLYSVFYRLVALKHPSKMQVLCDIVADGEYLLWGPVLILGRILV